MVTTHARLRHSKAAFPSERSPLRIAILGYRSDPNVGGQGVYVDYLSQSLAEAGAHVDVISGPPYPELTGDVRLLKIPSLDLYAQPHHGHYSLRPRHLLSPTDTYEYFGHLSGKFVEPYVFGQRAYRFLKQRVQDYDVILDNQTLANGTLRIQSSLKLPLVTMIHHPVTQDRTLALEAAQTWRQRWLIRRWYAFHHMQIRVARRLNVMTCPSEAAKNDIVDAFGIAPDRIHPIPLGVDQSAFRPRPHIQRSPKRIISTASADTPLKGLPVLLTAYRQLLDTHPGLELVVIGKLKNGQARRTLSELGLEHRVQFKSGLSRQELAEEFCRAAIAVTPSLYEGFGLPAAEAMSCGTPVIVTDGGALPEVAGKAGIVVPRGNANALATAIGDLLGRADARRSVGEACLKRAKAEFDWRRIAPRYLSLMEEARAHAC
ncbi:glycosyltransferase family 4 protein [Henriciella sp.]|uniref:glycosyltransferase family 4 protein n=1 Tax=Henriciella sp. TaxID=1968823 RepID=UPI00261CE450|nr:glycosyltransferase family 4 protein [Henriciella sp.]